MRLVGELGGKTIGLGLAVDRYRGKGFALVDSPETDVEILGGGCEDEVGVGGAWVLVREGEGADPVLVTGQVGLVNKVGTGRGSDVYGDVGS